MENGEYVVIVFLDLKRAFDREIMLQKLQSLEVHGVELSWFASYLTQRKQQTKYKSKFSDEMKVPIGLPQGVILFNIYIDSITKVPKHGSIVLFADDTAIKTKHKNLETAIN